MTLLTFKETHADSKRNVVISVRFQFKETEYEIILIVHKKIKLVYICVFYWMARVEQCQSKQ